jgi:hypothetical protein
MAEYGMMVQTLDIKPDMADLTAGEFSQNLTGSLGQLLHNAISGLKNFQQGDWEIVSHSLTRVDRHLVLSLLIRRHSQSALEKP